MDVAPGGVVGIEMHETRASGGVGHGQTGLFHALPDHRLLRGLAAIEVPTGLQPAAKTVVQMEYDTPLPHHHRRCGHMGGISVLVERSIQTLQLGEDDRPGQRLTLVTDRVLLHQGPNPPLSAVPAPDHPWVIGGMG